MFAYTQTRQKLLKQFAQKRYRSLARSMTGRCRLLSSVASCIAGWSGKADVNVSFHSKCTRCIRYSCHVVRHRRLIRYHFPQICLWQLSEVGRDLINIQQLLLLSTRRHNQMCINYVMKLKRSQENDGKFSWIFLFVLKTIVHGVLHSHSCFPAGNFPLVFSPSVCMEA